MLTQIEVEMKASRYNLKQRNLWVNEAILNLLSRIDYAALIAEEFMEAGSTTPIPVTLNDSINAKINVSLKHVEVEEGIVKDRSALLRTAIIQRLLTASGLQLSDKSMLRLKEAKDTD